MKRFIVTIALVVASLTIVYAKDKPVTFSQLPVAAQAFINKNFPDDKVSFASVDDDIIRPDYQVVLASGVMLDFENNGKLEKISTRNGNIPDGIIPAEILNAVNAQYPDAKVLEYEIDRRTYEVKLSNKLEIKFNSAFGIIEIDD